MYSSVLKKQREERKKLKALEFTGEEMWKALSILRNRAISLSEISHIKKTIKPEGNEFVKGRKKFTYEQAVLVLLVKMLRTHGIPLKVLAPWMTMMRIYVSGSDLSGYDFLLCDSKQMILYDARKETPILQNFDTENQQFFWSFNIGYSVAEADKILDQVKNG